MESTLFELETGQCLLLELRPGDLLWVQRGSLRAHPPARWEGGTLLLREEHWPESASWTAEARALWQCQALQGTTLVRQRRRLLPGWGSACRRLAAILARRAPAAPSRQQQTAAAGADMPARRRG